ncbi:DnaK suppressor protein [Chiayiivirga flava]|uniref:RNA polymerase-binding transcription factor DksA n=1 Tax=Chiayiivirga flava TaxID=659595 RepID=A0A7W8D313_9GAMM|nr:DnaK suppressor protein [Chiayiivirga flava]
MTAGEVIGARRGATRYNGRIRLLRSCVYAITPDRCGSRKHKALIVAAKPKPSKKPAAKAAKKPAKPAAKAAKPATKAAPARKAPAKPVAKAKPAAKKAAAKPAPARGKAASKAKPAPRPAAKPAAKPPAKSAVKAKPAAAAAKKGPVKRLAEKIVKLVTPAKAPPVVAAKPAKAAAPVKSAAPAKGRSADAATSAGSAMTAAVSKDSAPAAKPAAPRNVDGARAKAVKPNRVISQNEPPPLAVAQRVDLPPGYKPSASEEYMNPSQLEYFRQKLINWRAELVEESKQTIDNLREEVRDVGDDAERATRETENSLELRTRDRYRKLISKIDKALKRIEDGAYGYCEETGEEIGVERLEARPIATLCLDAQERWEHRQKLMGD